MKKIIPVIYVVGAVLILFGATTHITGWVYSSYLFVMGATLLSIAQINSFYRGNNKILRRLYGQQLLGAFFLLLAGFFMFFLVRNEWILAMSVGAFLELYTAFRIPREEKKEAENN